MKTDYEMLEETALFRNLPHRDLTLIREKMSTRRFKKGEIILNEEDTNKYMYILLKGRVKAVQTTEEGREIVLGFHTSGDTFGEVSLIDGKTTQAQVIAVADSLISIISKEEFYNLYHTHPKILDNLLNLLCSRFRENTDVIKMLNMNNAAQRLQMLFIKLVHSYGEPDQEGILLKLNLTHSDLANMASLTRETVTRIMNRWQKEGYIEVQGRRIHIANSFIKKII